jgi:hypothetical protein
MIYKQNNSQIKKIFFALQKTLCFWNASMEIFDNRPSRLKLQTEDTLFLECIQWDICTPISPLSWPFRCFMVLIDASSKRSKVCMCLGRPDVMTSALAKKGVSEKGGPETTWSTRTGPMGAWFGTWWELIPLDMTRFGCCMWIKGYSCHILSPMVWEKLTWGHASTIGQDQAPPSPASPPSKAMVRSSIICIPRGRVEVLVLEICELF